MLRRLLILTVSLLLLSSTFAAEETEFNPRAANKLLDKLSIKLSIQDVNIQNLDEAITELDELRNDAKSCTDDAGGQLDEVALLITEAFPEDAQPAALTDHQKYLQDKKAQLNARLSDCQLFVLRSSEAIDAFSETIQKLVTTKIFELEADSASNITKTIKDPSALWDKLDTKLIYEQSGLHLLNDILLIILGSLLLIGVAIGLKLKQLLGRRIQFESTDVFSEQLFQAFFAVARIKVTKIIFLSIMAIFGTILTLGLEHTPTLLTIVYGSLFYVTVVSIIRFIIFPPEPARGLSNLRADTASSLLHRIKLLARLSLLGFIILTVFQSQPFPDYAINSFRTIFVTLLALNLIGIVWLVNRIPKLHYRFIWLRIFLSTAFGFGLITILASEWVGYHNFSSFLLRSTSITLSLIFITWFLHRLITAGIDALSGTKHAWQQRFRQHLGIKRFEGIPELLWLRAVSSLVIWGGFFLLLLKTWGLSDTNFDNIIDGIMNGFHMAGLEVIPSRIIFAILLFSTSLSLIRWFRTRFAKKSKITVEPGAREAIAAVFSYAMFALVLLFALLFAGVNFAGLAIIAGALSVGIGFGLQNIVNNFVSGIILLIERPIKPGDRIIVGETDGYVKKISIRSTQIRTLKHSDVIVPNSEILSTQVTNLMFHDLRGRVSIFVGIAYGSDIDLVKKLLQEIAEAHPHVMDSKSVDNAILVLFNRFGDNSLEFELRVVIKDIDEQYIVKSELNFEVDKAFRKHKIEIAFPQRDLHIRDWTKVSDT